ncbi:hypothetical protein BABINDRAFT_161064 [Babjeviella inositovora NRRL Y-12698]|uniref:ER-derived vesicles protein ERV29 n=1 Tax=Babjeviella inositovora NRRL Y-12698 TaxID=984486 RepID=A0A1E3QT75_9ASCO|nr:uncharacterized protein BABINDRAFT_161064 [Babjeviella inositovora NRRL Y-12698]ODQ80870.1 hypothetical protein BABINDRAFT_161064 [Babjeviella inositovora NRRL Y-12698]
MSFRGSPFDQPQAGFDGRATHSPQQQYSAGFAGSAAPASALDNAVEKFEKFAAVIESKVDTYTGPIKPYVPSIARFLIVATFYEDSSRIVTQWKDQVLYLNNYKGIPWFIVVVFLMLNVVVMVIASTFLIMRKQEKYTIPALVGVIVSQGLFYGLIFDYSFLLRSLSVMGGLSITFSDSIIRDKRSLAMPGLPMLEYKDNRKYFLLAGRLMLLLLFVGFLFAGKLTFIRLFLKLVGAICCVSVAVGYKTKFAAIGLCTLLFFYNLSVNHYWSYDYVDATRDLLRYEYFQTLSIVGGLLIIVNTGAGEFSIDEKKKTY